MTLLSRAAVPRPQEQWDSSECGHGHSTMQVRAGAAVLCVSIATQVKAPCCQLSASNGAQLLCVQHDARAEWG